MQRTLAMTVPDPRPEMRPPSREGFLPRWVGVVFPVVVGAGVVFAGVYAADRSSLPLAVALAATSGVGLAAGLVVRWSMPDRPGVLRWLVALAASLIGLMTVGLLTNGAIGILPRPAPGGRTQWAELAELLAAGGLAWLALGAWKRRAPNLSEDGLHARMAVGVPVPVGPPPVIPPAASPPATRTSGRRSVVPEEPRGGIRPSTASPSGGGIGGAWRRLRAAIVWPHAPQLQVPEPTRRRRRSASDIRLTGVTEHRCPYCLELVANSDPRGVVLCPVCHTPHHADCWSVTGTCQVPHAYRSP
jgi:Prokaryotic RING finger family 1